MRHRLAVSLCAAAACATPLLAQGTAAPAATATPAARPAPVILTAAQQIAAAVLPLPDSLRAGARVWGYAADGRFVELRAGSGSMTCIADDPRDNAPDERGRGNRFHVACYANTMEPYMARGRELRAQGANESTVDSVRTADVMAGRIHLPSVAMLYSLTGTAANYNATASTITGARPLFVVYTPFATAEQLGLSSLARRGQPWMMHGGQPGAHIMFVPDM